MVHRSIEQCSPIFAAPQPSFFSRAIATVSDFFHRSPTVDLTPHGSNILSEIAKNYVHDEFRRASSSAFSFVLKNADPSASLEIGEFHWMVRRQIPLVQQLQAKCGQVVSDDDYFKTALGERNCVSMCVDIGDRTVAGAIYRLDHFDVKLEVVVVDPEYQRRGVGTQLLGKIESLSAGRRIEMIFDVNDDNLAGHLWLSRIGFMAKTVIKPESGGDLYRFTRPIVWR